MNYLFKYILFVRYTCDNNYTDLTSAKFYYLFIKSWVINIVHKILESMGQASVT